MKFYILDNYLFSQSRDASGGLAAILSVSLYLLAADWLS